MSDVIVRSRTCGVKDIYVAKVTANNETTYTAETPVKIARAIKMKIDEKWETDKEYSDDATEGQYSSYTGSEVEMEVNALAPQDRSQLFGQLYKNGFLVKTANDQAPELALGFRERKLSGKYEFHWLYTGKFATGISEEMDTKAGKIATKTKSIKGSFYERQKDAAYETVVDENNLLETYTDAAKAITEWFKEVQEPVTTTTP